MKVKLAALVAGSLLLPTLAAAQNPAVSIAVDASANRHAIDPRIYGLAYASGAELSDLNCPLNRQGGNPTSRYNWLQNADNRAADYYFESIGYDSATAGGYPDDFIAETRAAGAQPMLTLPMVGWVAKLGAGRAKRASFSIAKYGAQTGSDYYFPDAGTGIASSTGDAITGNDPNDADVPADASFQQGWVQHLVGKWGSAAGGGVRYYLYDNEPSIWHATHRDVHPGGAAMAEVRDKIFSYGAMVRAQDPGAILVGPEEWGWDGYYFSGLDQKYYADHCTGGGACVLPDQAAHAGQNYLPWLLDQLRQHEVATGERLLDVFAVHFYPQGGEFGDDVSTPMQLLRNRSTRALWDPSYVNESWIASTGIDGGVVKLIPRLKAWVAAHDPGLQVGVTEYNWGAEGHINGALAQADVLGILGREGADLATRWTTPDPSTPTYQAIKMYRSYDGARSTFGDTSVAATGGNPDQLAPFAAQRSADGALTVMLVEKALSGSTPVTVHLAGFTPASSAQVWRVSAAAGAIQHLPNAAVAGGAVSLTLAPQSLTLLVVPPGAAPPPPPSCTPDATTACLGGGRFQVTVDWQTSTASGAGRVMSFGGQRAENDDSVFYWFFSSTNFEMGLKVLDGCAVNGKFWVFVSGLTNQGWTVHVHDTATGATKTYSNALGHLTTTTADTSALSCP
jgi:hypothetical protein